MRSIAGPAGVTRTPPAQGSPLKPPCAERHRARGRISLLVVHRRCHSAPAPGFRDSGYRTAENGAGKLYGVGYAGYLWSSTIPTGSGYAHYLLFNYGGIGPQGNDHRAYGFPLRCLQE